MFQRVTAVVVLCVLLGAACSSDSSPDPGVSTVETVTTQTLQSATKAELDVDIEGFIAEIPDEKVRASVENALDLAEEVAKPCATPAQWSIAADDAAEALSAAAAKIEASETLEEWRSAAVEVGMVDYFVKLMAVDPLCVGGQQSDRDTVWRSAVGVLGALDELQSVVSPGVSGRASSVFWLDSDVLGHTVEVQRLVSGGEAIDLLVVGDSTTKQGVDPVALGNALDRSAANVSLNGMMPDGVRPWLHDVGTLGVSPSLIVFGVSPWSSFVPCGDLRAVLYDGTVQQREVAFAGVDLLADIEPQERASGGATLAPAGPLIDEYSKVFEERGRFAGSLKPVGETALEKRRSYYSTLMSAVEKCESRPEELKTLITELRSSGVDVVVMTMPVGGEMASMHPDGRAGHSELADRYEQVADESGAMFLRFTDLLSDDEFGDIAHPNGAGMARLTSALSNELAQLN